VTTVRVRFSKLGKVRWTSHRDVARIWERALRRAELPVAYTEGFSPRPRLAFGLALPTGHESLGEYLDVDLKQPVALDQLPERLSAMLPGGMECMAALDRPGGLRSLQQDVTACRWEIELEGVEQDAAAAAADAALCANELMVTRSRKGRDGVDDVRPAILALAIVGRGEAGAVVAAEVATQPRGLRPAELLEACFAGAEARRVVRTHQWIDSDGARREPVPVDATSFPHATRACA
jgi:radical SAM-linked protein